MTRLIPMIPVANLSRSVEFYAKLGFSVEQRKDSWGWAMLRFDDCRIMLSHSFNIHSSPPSQSILYLYPDDIDLYHEQLKASGVVTPDLDKTFYGMTEFRLDDPDGNRLWFGQNREPRAGVA